MRRRDGVKYIPINGRERDTRCWPASTTFWSRLCFFYCLFFRCIIFPYLFIRTSFTIVVVMWCSSKTISWSQPQVSWIRLSYPNLTSWKLKLLFENVRFLLGKCDDFVNMLHRLVQWYIFCSFYEILSKLYHKMDRKI